MGNETFVIIVLIVVAGLFGYSLAKGDCQKMSEDYARLKTEYAQLNESYNQKVQENSALRIENEQLKAQQKQLSDQIAAYLVEQVGIDLLGLKKYSMAWDLLKIGICNKSPSIIFC